MPAPASGNAPRFIELGTLNELPASDGSQPTQPAADDVEPTVLGVALEQDDAGAVVGVELQHAKARDGEIADSRRLVRLLDRLRQRRGSGNLGRVEPGERAM